MSELDYYKLLGINRNASASDIKHAFREQARHYHPDSGGAEASELMFRQINEAYSVLSNTGKRKLYDEMHPTSGIAEGVKAYKNSSFGDAKGFDKDAAGAKDSFTKSTAFDGHAKKKNQPASQFNKSWGKAHSDITSGGSILNSLNKLKEKASSVLASGFSEPRISKSKSKPKEKPNVVDALRGERVYQLTVDALESITGATREVAIGTEDEPQRISVHIPAQIEDGGEFTFDGKQNGQRAVFKAKVTVVDHPFVSRRGLDLTFRVPISIQEAIQGTTVSIPYSNGPLEINIPPQKGLPSRITLPKRGLRDKRSSKHGDLNIDPIVTVPDVESEVVKEAAKAMEAFYKTPVRSKLPKN